MAVNLLKNKVSMQKAWSDIVDDNNSSKWAVFSYDGKTFDLQLHSTGDGELQEMIEELNSGKIMYAVCRVIDPKTSLPKFVLINWQGEGAPGDRKGKCANHIRDINDFFKGIHITINARTEDDVEPNLIIEKVSKATGSVYSFKDRAGPLENHTPVGSVYKRIVPAAEINSRERDRFWEKQEVEEKRRVEEERKKLEDAKTLLETERTRREIEDAKRREEFVKNRTKAINEIRAAEKVTAKSIVETEKLRWQKQIKDDEVESETRLKKNEHMRLERNQEVESLIGQRTLNARAIFEQNTVVGQMSTMRSSSISANQIKNSFRSSSSNGNSYSFPESDSSSSLSTSCEKPSSPDRTPPSPEPESIMMRTHQVSSNVDTSQYSATQVILEEESQSNVQNTNQVVSNVDTAQYSATRVVLGEEEEPYNHNGSQDETDNDVVAQYALAHDDGQSHTGESTLIVRALYDYQAADETEISFNPDDIITHVNTIDEGWWQGLAPDGTYGLFPANYVEVIE